MIEAMTAGIIATIIILAVGWILLQIKTFFSRLFSNREDE